MDFENIDINKIQIKNSIRNSYDISYDNINTLDFLTPVLYSPFGIDRKYNDFFLNLQLRDYKKFPILSNFLEFIQNIENRLIKLLDIKPFMFNSQLRFNKDHDPLLYTKIINKNNKCITEIKKNNEFMNLFNIGDKFYTKCLLSIDKIWIKNNNFYYKIKIKNINIIE
jgi:hypothetical protein